MLEADVGEFPQQVVHQHKGPGGRHHRVVGVDPEDVVGRAGRRPRPGTDPQGQHAPGLRAPHGVDHRRLVCRCDRDQEIAGLTRHPGLRDGIGFDECDRGQRPLPHDHGMDELDGDVVGMRFPLRRNHPEGGAVVESAGQVQRGGSQIGGQIHTDVRPSELRGRRHSRSPLRTPVCSDPAATETLSERMVLTSSSVACVADFSAAL